MVFLWRDMVQELSTPYGYSVGPIGQKTLHVDPRHTRDSCVLRLIERRMGVENRGGIQHGF